jgi:hypothetical protein
MRRVHHEPGCPKRNDPSLPCACAELEDELLPGSLPDPDQAHQSLASLIRKARRAGLLRPLQQYGGGHAPASAP